VWASAQRGGVALERARSVPASSSGSAGSSTSRALAPILHSAGAPVEPPPRSRSDSVEADRHLSGPADAHGLAQRQLLTAAAAVLSSKPVQPARRFPVALDKLLGRADNTGQAATAVATHQRHTSSRARQLSQSSPPGRCTFRYRGKSVWCTSVRFSMARSASKGRTGA
jgi:hypothetical protein